MLIYIISTNIIFIKWYNYKFGEGMNELLAWTNKYVKFSP